MSEEILYSIIGIIGLIGIVIFTLSNTKSTKIQTPTQTKQDIIDRYKQELIKALTPLKDDKQARISKKNELLKKFNQELALNIYFDKSEIREVILELLKDS
ncbi:hypothetical protein [Sulfurimonas sp.]|uniref:hypothetical protein n=1 Tax=Sulfurimonas sp. TaxID=2022749 RepID=UPI002AB305B9|nr:hypothetical protein [Sulfurimonas sp.]